MRRLIVGLGIVVACVVLWTGPLWAQEATTQEGRSRWGGRTRQPGAEGRREVGREELDARRVNELIASLHLTPGQQTRVTQIFDTHRQALANWQSTNDPKMEELRGKIREARRNQQDEQAKALADELQTIVDSRRQFQEELFKQLKDVLDDEQMLQVQDFFSGRFRMPFMMSLQRIELTDAQKDHVWQVLQAAKAQVKATEDANKRMELIRGAYDKIKSEVLTAEQRTKLEELMQRPGRPLQTRFMGVELTLAQTQQAEAIRREATTKARDVQDREERRKIMQESTQRIMKEVLTDEQRRQIESAGQPPGGPIGEPREGQPDAR